MIITDNGANIQIEYSTNDIIAVPKDVSIELTNGLIWIDYWSDDRQIIIDWTDVTSPIVTSAADLFALLQSYIASGGSSVEPFTATPGQTTYVPIMPPNNSTQCEIAGVVYSVGTGISQDGTTITFSAPFIGGEICIVRTW